MGRELNLTGKLFFFIFLLKSVFPAGSLCQDSWSKELPAMGTFSSPRIADLNRDGTGDIILGAGRLEFQACDSAIIALDGNTGDLLWNVAATDQIFGSAQLKDITGDGIPDVFIGGRSAELKAINGRTGEVIWSFADSLTRSERKKKIWFNFYNPQFIPDQNGDGLEDIIVSNGGDVMVEPYDQDRPPGHLVILNTKNGKVIAMAPMPDGRETYMSVAVSATPDGKVRVIFGTGGETIGGHLYVTPITDILDNRINEAITLDSSSNKGFIGPPVWIDINNDGIHDILANAVDGRLLAFDGNSNDKLWQVTMPDTEAYSSIAPGYFNADSIPDIFVSYAQGVWPDLDWTKQFMVNGIDGTVEFADSLGFYQTSTPVVADFTGDGTDDALVVVNYQVIRELYQKWFYNLLAVIDFTTNEVIDLGVTTDGHNLSSTPWIGDLDNDNNLDIIYCHSTNNRHTYAFDGMMVERIRTTIPIKKEIEWGAYMGSDYNGVFNK